MLCSSCSLRISASHWSRVYYSTDIVCAPCHSVGPHPLKKNVHEMIGQTNSACLSNRANRATVMSVLFHSLGVASGMTGTAGTPQLAAASHYRIRKCSQVTQKIQSELILALEFVGFSCCCLFGGVQYDCQVG